ncbi:MAG: NAD(P)-dependent oxidoreductase [Bacteroidota bacterium]
MKEKLLITGASGFLGYHLIEAALLQDYEVYAGVRKSSSTGHLLNEDRVHVLQMDLSDLGSIKNTLEQHGITHIIHAAALTKAKTASAYNFSNAELTRNLAMAAAESSRGIQKFVFVSSLAALGPALNGEPVKEDAVPRPLTWYGKSKLLAEQYLGEIPNLPFIGLRPTAVYGPREKDLLLLIKSVSRGLEVYIGKTEQQLSFVYVKDLAALAVKCLHSKIIGEFYNIGDGNVYNRYAFADAAKKATGRKTIRLQLPLALIETIAGGMDALYSRSSNTPVLNKEKLKELTAKDWSCSIIKSQKDLDFQPLYDLESGMAETVQWYKNNRWI